MFRLLIQIITCLKCPITHFNAVKIALLALLQTTDNAIVVPQCLLFSLNSSYLSSNCLEPVLSGISGQEKRLRGQIRAKHLRVQVDCTVKAL